MLIPAVAAVRIHTDSADAGAPASRFALSELLTALQTERRGVEAAEVGDVPFDDGDVVVCGPGVLGDEPVPGGEGYRITRTETRTGRSVTAVLAAEPAGRVYGMLRLAQLIGRDGKLPDRIGESSTPAYSLRMVEAEAPFYPPEDRSERPYWLAGYRDMYNTDKEPYLDLDRFEQIPRRFETYCQEMLKDGYNTILFIQVQGRWVDPELWDEVKLDEPRRQRLAQWRALYQRLVGIADSYGMRTYLWLSEATFPEEVTAHLTEEGAFVRRRRSLSVRIEHPALQAAMEKKYRYLVETYPGLAGFLIRVGELGGGEAGAVVYVDPDGKASAEQRVADFFGTMEKLIQNTLHREMIARTWWVGDPSIHTDPALYKTAVSKIESPSTWVCIKNTHEFWGAMPENKTLAVATQPLIVEYQASREYDGMGSVPVVMAEHYAARFASLQAIQPEGMWAWVKFGGSGGKYRVPYSHGFEDWTEAATYILGRLAWDPSASAGKLRHEFALTKVHPRIADDYARIMELSEVARNLGMYTVPVTEDNPWHPMFPTYRTYFYAGELVAREDGASTSDPVGYIFEHWKDRRVEMVANAHRALALRRECLALAERVSRGMRPERAEGLLLSVRHGVLLQDALTAWIVAANAYYEWTDAGRPAAGKADVVALLDILQATRERYDEAFGEYVDRQMGMNGWLRLAREGIAGT